jgi:cellulose synthase/poly-beta-1,6-N-acetylglucosamine synthase-like glycosyltransferase
MATDSSAHGQTLGASDGDLVSVVIPAYNAEGTASHTLRSVLGQTYANFEVGH